MSTDCTSSMSSISSATSSVETFSSSMAAPITILKTPKATGSFLNSVFHYRPSILIFSMIYFPSTSRSVSGPYGFTSQITRDLATGAAFFGFLDSSAALLSCFLASAASSSSESSESKRPISSSNSSSFFPFGVFFFLSCTFSNSSSTARGFGVASFLFSSIVYACFLL